MSVNINFKEREITMVEKIEFTHADGKQEEFADMQEFSGVVNPVDVKFHEFNEEGRFRHLKIYGENDVFLGDLHQPWSSPYEHKPSAEDMRREAIEHLLANDSELRAIMNGILVSSEKGEFSVLARDLQEPYLSILNELGYKCKPEEVGRGTWKIEWL